MNVTRFLLANSLVAASLFMICPTSAEDWPQFLGANRNGISAEENLIDEFPADGPKIAWRVAGGVGMSGLAIADGAVYTMTQNSQDQFLVKRDATTGEQIWRAIAGIRYRNEMGNGPRATPAVAGERVFVYTGEGILGAFSVSDGKPIWKKNAVTELDGKIADYGMASSPIVIGEQVIVTVGAPNATVASFAVEDGKLNWTAGSDRCGYSSSALLDVNGEQQLVTYTGNSAIGIDPNSGELLWRYAYETDYDCNTATPISVDGKVFISSGENHGCVLLNITKEGNAYDVAEVWSSQGRESVMRNEWQTSILINGHLYGFDNVGSAGAVTHFTCVDAMTGERQWQEIRFGKGNAIAADGKFFMTTMEGDVVIVKVDENGFQELARADVDCKTRQAPALSNGMLYLRDDRDIICIDLRQ